MKRTLIITLLVFLSSLNYAQSEISNGSLTIGKEYNSLNGNYFFVFQSDGNLVVYLRDIRAIWNSKTNGQGADKCIMQQDGNLVIYTGTNVLWSTGTADYTHKDTKLVIQNDGNLVLLWQIPCTVVPLWSSKTGKWNSDQIQEFINNKCK